MAVPGVPVVAADGACLPFPDGVFDALHANAALQHVPDPAAVLREARRVSRPGAVIGVGDVDWGASLRHPADPLLERGLRLQEALREQGDVRIGRKLRGLVTAAGFDRVEVAVTGNAVGTADAVAATARFESGWFEAPDVVANVTALGLSDAEEMAAVAAAWRRWGADPGACSGALWFTAVRGRRDRERVPGSVGRMCATCVAQGAAYLVPAYAVVRTRRWRRRHRTPDGEGVTSAWAVDDRRRREVDA